MQTVLMILHSVQTGHNVVSSVQLVQTVLMILHCDQSGQNATIAASPSSWNYSVTEGCGWAISTADNLNNSS